MIRIFIISPNLMKKISKFKETFLRGKKQNYMHITLIYFQII
jgi:hypothetical protein